MTAERRIHLDGDNGQVQITAGEGDAVTVELGDGANGITLVGSRYDVHRLILEADKQLARLSYPRFAVPHRNGHRR